jgi:DNA polymerase-4
MRSAVSEFPPLTGTSRETVMGNSFASERVLSSEQTLSSEQVSSSERTILHIDVNAAFLSWEAVFRLQHGDKADLRLIPSVVGGDETTRHGIVLAKSLPAKQYGIQTGQPLWQARQLCPLLVTVPPDPTLYVECSNALMALLTAYSPSIERYSIDECFLELTGSPRLQTRTPKEIADEIREKVRRELGFTVNIGVSSNKLLAKMASELEKPDRTHTLYPYEVPEKMWTLPVRELFMVGPRSAPRLYRLNIFSIGHLAQTDPALLQRHFKRFGRLMWQFANGLDNTPVCTETAAAKAIGNSATTPCNVDTEREALLFLLSLTETAAMRLRQADLLARVVSVAIRRTDLAFASHQRRLRVPTDHTGTLFSTVRGLFQELWTGDPLRHFGVAFSDLADDQFIQSSLFDEGGNPQQRALDESIDALRAQYGKESLIRGSFIASGIPPMAGGLQEGYPGMRNRL